MSCRLIQQCNTYSVVSEVTSLTAYLPCCFLQKLGSPQGEIERCGSKSARQRDGDLHRLGARSTAADQHYRLSRQGLRHAPRHQLPACPDTPQLQSVYHSVCILGLLRLKSILYSTSFDLHRGKLFSTSVPNILAVPQVLNIRNLFSG